MKTFSDLDKKKKREHIWYYYKWHMIISVILVVVLGNFIYTQITKTEYVFNLTLIGNNVQSDKLDSLEKKLTAIAVDNPGKKRSAQVECYLEESLTGSTGAMTSQYIQKFTAEVAANVIDVIILNRQDYDNFVKQGVFMPLEDTKAYYEDVAKAIGIESKPENSKKGFYGYKIDDNKVLSSYGINSKDKVLCIVSSSKQKDEAVKVVNWIIGK